MTWDAWLIRLGKKNPHHSSDTSIGSRHLDFTLSPMGNSSTISSQRDWSILSAQLRRYSHIRNSICNSNLIYYIFYLFSFSFSSCFPHRPRLKLPWTLKLSLIPRRPNSLLPHLRPPLRPPILLLHLPKFRPRFRLIHRRQAPL